MFHAKAAGGCRRDNYIASGSAGGGGGGDVFLPLPR